MLNRIGSVRATLASRAGRPADEIELKVAASVTHLGLVARLIAPALAAIASQHQLDMRLGGLWWQDTLGGPVPLSVPERDHPVPGNGQSHGPVAEPDCHRLVDDMIAPITAAISGLVPVSHRVLWGNVASAVNGAAQQVAAQRADLGRQAWTVAAAFFSSPRLTGERQLPGPGFRRSSCCLIYRIAADRVNGVCGDCVLGAPSSGPATLAEKGGRKDSTWPTSGT
jgi:hypothetical protein